MTLVVQEVGKTSRMICSLEKGDEVLDLAGPLGRPAPLPEDGHAVLVGGGFGAGAIYPLARALRARGTIVTSLVGARTAELVILRDLLEPESDEYLVCTDDGSLGYHGFTAALLGEELAAGAPYTVCYAVGPVAMMRAVAEVTRPHGLLTYVSLDPIMLDGTGMCGACRITVGGETKFACVDGPFFDAHEVAFDEAVVRSKMYVDEERIALEIGRSDVAMPIVYPAKTAMPQLDPVERRATWDEVAVGYTVERALAEAQRCVQCQDPLCEQGCPVGVPIRDFIRRVALEDFAGASAIIRTRNVLPAICGRVCPVEHQCERYCATLGRLDPVGIGRLERFVADWERKQPHDGAEATAERRAEKIAIVGSGPAGLTAASDLAQLGYGVTVFEALHAVGGVLRYGIPEFRLPKAIVDEDVERLRGLGVDFETNVVVGKTVTIDELLDGLGYSAVFVGTGAGSPKFMGLPGENLKGVYSANEYLTRVNLMRAYSFPDYDTPVKRPTKAVVIGAGDTAMDAVRVSIRLGAEEARIVYRRSEHEMGARAEDYRRASEEGAIFEWLTLPTALPRRRRRTRARRRVHPHRARRARRVGPPQPGPDPGLRGRPRGEPRRHRARHEPQPARPPDDDRARHRPARVHRHRPGDRCDKPARRLRRRRHRNGRGDRHPRHGSGPPCGNRHPLLRAVESSERKSRWKTTRSRLIRPGSSHP